MRKIENLMRKISLSEQRQRLEQSRQRFEDVRSEADVLRGKYQAAMEQLKKFGVASVKNAKTLMQREERKEERILVDMVELLDELEEEVGMSTTAS